MSGIPNDFSIGQFVFSKGEIADVLEQAAEHVRAGWTQGRVAEYVGDQLYVCSSGAVWLGAGMQIARSAHENGRVVMTSGVTANECSSIHADYARDYWEQERLYQLWSRSLDILQAHVADNVAQWNDSLGQTQERVVDTMLRLAKELRNNETP